MPFSVDLGHKLEAVVARLVKSGRYNSKSEVLREGIRLVQEREARIAALDAAVQRGLADADAGRVAPAEAVFAELRTKYQAIARKVEADETRPDRRGSRRPRSDR